MQTTFKKSTFRLPCLTALLFLSCLFNTAHSQDIEYLDKTFYLVFPDGAVITGHVAGTPTRSTERSAYIELTGLDTLSVTIAVPAEDGSVISKSWLYDKNDDPSSNELNWFQLQWYSADPEQWYPVPPYLIPPSWFCFVLNGFEFYLEPKGFLQTFEEPKRSTDIIRYYWDDGTSFSSSETTLDQLQFSDTDDNASMGWLEEYIAAGRDSALIDNAGIAVSLLSMAEAAGSAVANDNTQAAVRILDAFIHRVEGQSGHQIDPFMAELLMAEARSVIDSLDE